MAQKQAPQSQQERLTHSDEIDAYLSSHSSYQATGIEQENSPLSLAYLAYADRVSFYARQYIAGADYAVLFVLDEVEALFTFDPPTAMLMTQFALRKIEEHLLEKEWYELLPRLIQVRQVAQNVLDSQPPFKSNQIH